MARRNVCVGMCVEKRGREREREEANRETGDGEWK